MNEKKYRRLEYLKQNIDYLTIRERQEYYDLLSEFNEEHQYFEGGANDFDENNLSGEMQNSQSDFGGFRRSENSERRRRSGSDDSSQYGSQSQQYEEDYDLGDESSLKKGLKKKKPRKKKSIIKRILLVLLLIILVMMGFFIYGYSRGLKHSGGAIQPEQFTSQKNSDGTVNILLLGADKRPGEKSGSARTDSIMVLHLDAKNQKANLVSFMRDTLVNIEGVSQSTGADVKVNAAFAVGELNRQGVELTSQTLKRNFGVNIQYYAVIDFSGFATVIDSLFPGGVEIDAQFSTVGGRKLDAVPVPDDLAATEGIVSSDKNLSASEATALGYPDGSGIFMMIKPGKQKMNGRTLLNYARFRHDDEGDAGRVKRQQQVMSTIISNVKNPLTLFTGASALGTTRAITMSNIPDSFILTNGLGTLLSLRNGTNSYTIPQPNDWQNAYDIYGGLGLAIDMQKYQAKSEELLGK